MIFLARGIPINKARESGEQNFNAVLMVAKGFRLSVSLLVRDLGRQLASMNAQGSMIAWGLSAL